METPVTYFYTDRPRTLQVRVEMPHGILTHWFPVALNIGPDPSLKNPSPRSGSFLDWGRVALVPEGGPSSSLSPVGPESTWRFARETSAALVKVRSGRLSKAAEYDWEKFLFYRGLGTFELPLEIRSTGSAADLRTILRNRGPQPLRGLFVIRVEDNTIRFAALESLAPGRSLEKGASALLAREDSLAEGVPRAKSAVAAALVSAGLFPKEARAMVNTWEKSYFRTEGLRVLYLLPRATVDGVIPLRIAPPPNELVRVMVGRVEVLTPERERKIAGWVSDLGSEEPEVRNAARTALARLGRLAEPALRRVERLTSSPAVRGRAEALIAKTAAAH